MLEATYPNDTFLPEKKQSKRQFKKIECLPSSPMPKKPFEGSRMWYVLDFIRNIKTLYTQILFFTRLQKRLSSLVRLRSSS